MNAVIMAGGFGKRLAPLTDLAPKPMLTVANTPIIDYTVSHLTDFGIREFIFTLGFMPEILIEWAIGYQNTVCRFMIEHEPLGTLGGIKAAEDFLDETFLVLSGDAVENINLDAMLHKHFSSGAQITMAVTEVSDTQSFGVPELDAWGFATGYTEKPPKGAAKSSYANCGAYVVDKSVLQRVPKDIKTDFSLDLFPVLVQERKLAAYIHDGYWRDLGTPQSYFEANFELMKGGFFPPAPSRRRDRCASFLAGKPHGSLVSVSAVIEGGARRSVVGADAIIRRGAEIDACVVLEGAQVCGSHRNSIIGKDFELEIKLSEFLPPPYEFANFQKNFSKNL